MTKGPALRVLMTVDAVGGVWQYASELVRGLAAEQIETVLAVLGPAPTPEQITAIGGTRILSTGLPLEWTAMETGAVQNAGRQIARMANDLRVDLVHLNSPALAASAPFLCPVLSVCHSCLATWWAAVRGGPLPEDFVWRAALTGQGLSNSDAVIVPTAAFGSALTSAYDLSPFPEVVWNGRTPPDVERRAGAASPFAFTAGRLWDEGKNAETLDRVAARLGLPFFAAGSVGGPNGSRIAPQSLRLLGPLSDRAIAEQLAQRPVFVSLARYEPFGLAVLEAAQAGCPLVLSDIPTFRELWDGAALFVDAEDDGAAAHAIEMIVGDADARRAFGQAAADRAARYTPAAMTDGVLEIYRRLLSRHELNEAAE